MQSPQIKFIASDMDGTLLNEQGRLDAEFFPIYQQLQQQSILFAAASGRQYYSLLETFAAIKDDMLFIAENGTLVMHQGKELYSCTIDKTAIHAILIQARAIDGAFTVLCGKNSAYIETQDPQALAEISKYYHRCQYVEDLLQVEDEFIKVAICYFSGTEQYVYPTIYSHFGDRQQVVVSAKIWLDVMHAEASKGAAIKHLQQSLGFSYEQSMAFGDYFNDVEMLQACYHSYAVDNAHPQVKQHARFQTLSNQQSGVLVILRSLLKNM